LGGRIFVRPSPKAKLLCRHSLVGFNASWSSLSWLVSTSRSARRRARRDTAASTSVGDIPVGSGTTLGNRGTSVVGRGGAGGDVQHVQEGQQELFSQCEGGGVQEVVDGGHALRKPSVAAEVGVGQDRGVFVRREGTRVEAGDESESVGVRGCRTGFQGCLNRLGETRPEVREAVEGRAVQRDVEVRRGGLVAELRLGEPAGGAAVMIYRCPNKK
jgi:hypothetical protein